MALLVVVLVGLLITSATGALMPAAAISGPTLVVSPSSGKAGSWAKATGSLFSEEGDPEFPPETIIRFNGIEVASAYGGGSFTLSFQVPSGIPPGDYPVQAFRGSQVASATFTVVTLPVASFAMTPSSGTGPVPLVVQCNDTSTGSPTSWWWSFGDDSTSTLQNPSHTYRKTGTYKVTLTVTNPAGKSTRERAITVYQPTLMASPVSGRAGSMVTVNGSSFSYDMKATPRVTLFFNGVEISRDIPMTRVGTLGSFMASFVIPDDTPAGTYSIRAENLPDTAEAMFTVTNRAPLALIDADPLSGTAPLSVHFNGSRSYDEDGAISSYRWNFGDTRSATGATADHTYTQSGEYRVILTVTDNQGYSGTSSVTIRTDNTPPVAEARATPVSGPAPLTVNFEGIQSHDPDGKVRSFSWDFGDGTSERTASTSHQYRDPGSYTAELTVTDDQGATGKDEVVITVGNEPPVAVIGISAKRGSVPLMVTFDGSRSFDPDGTALTYSWDFGDGTTGTRKTTSHTYEEEGTYDIFLVVTDMYGASSRAEEIVIAESPVPVIPPVVPLVSVVVVLAGAAVTLWYIRQRKMDDHHGNASDNRFPKSEFHITTDSGLEYETGMKRTSDEFPDISVEVRSGIWREGDKK